MLRVVLRGLAALTVLGLPALTLLSCVQRPALAIRTSSGDVIPLAPWAATLATPATGIRGTATLEPGPTLHETRATIVLAGATPHAVHAWYVQLGECGHELGILAGPQEYAPIVVDARGDGRSIVTLPFTVPTKGRYSATVRRSESEASPVVACGNLTKGALTESSNLAQARAP